MPGATLPEKILFVDDEPEVINSFRRQLRGKLNIHAAGSGDEGLAKLDQLGPFAVVVSDLKMPGMNGVEFLSQVNKVAPQTVRILLTGYADVNSAVAAVNESNIFRFLTKPCPEDQLVKALVAAIKQYRLLVAERDILEKTLQGSIKVLSEVLAWVNPRAFGRASRIAYYVKEIGRALDYASPWELESATMLSQIGYLTLPHDLLNKVYRNQKLDEGEQALFRQHPSMAGELIGSIPRLDEVRSIITYQDKAFDGSGPPDDELAGKDIPLGARVLKVVLDFDSIVQAGSSKAKALDALQRTPHLYDPGVLAILEAVLGEEGRLDVFELGLYDLEPGMILGQDVLSLSGDRKLLAEGQSLSETLIMTLRNFNRALGVKEPIKVRVPLKK